MSKTTPSGPAPRVSVIMPVYNGAPFVREAIDTVLCQTFRDFEFIVVDDASTDETPLILDKYTDPRIRRYRNERNLGLVKTLNRGLATAVGEFVARQDADDLSASGRLGLQASFLDVHQECGLLGTAYEVIDGEGKRLALHERPVSDTAIRWTQLFHNAFCHSSVMFRRNVLATVGGGYSERFRFTEDYELWGRMLLHTRGANLADFLVAWRHRGTSVSMCNREVQQREADQIAEQHIRQVVSKMSFDPAEIRKLRDWFYGFPERLSSADMPLAGKMWAIVRAFGRQTGIDRREANEIRAQWAQRILAAGIHATQGMWRRRLAWRLRHTAPAFAVELMVRCGSAQQSGRAGAIPRGSTDR